jgi:transcriptional regulatory protein LevR/transcriptional regulator with AAA-type ATPase domain
MKTNKEKIYDILRMHEAEGGVDGFTAQHLSQITGITRANVSAVVNELTKEGLVAKSLGRPVKYRIKRTFTQTGCFEEMVGYSGSLARCVQLAQAAVCYPGGIMHVLIAGKPGTGRSLMAALIYRYAVETGVLPEAAPFVTFDCTHDTVPNEVFESARGGIIVLDNAHLVRDKAWEGIKPWFVNSADSVERDANHTVIIALCDDVASEYLLLFRVKYGVAFRIPELAERPLEERKQLVHVFFLREAAFLKRAINLNAELLRCLLAYECGLNVAQLKADIKYACANAYARELQRADGKMSLYISDFGSYVYRAFLHSSLWGEEMCGAVPVGVKYRFSETGISVIPARDKNVPESIYSFSKRQKLELMESGMIAGYINRLTSDEWELIFRAYQGELAETVSNLEELARLVNPEILSLADDCLKAATEKTGETYPVSVLWGLCLHLEASINGEAAPVLLGEKQAREIAENYKTEYAVCLHLAARMEQAFDKRLPAEEIALLTAFLCFKAAPEQGAKPGLLFALRGAGLARCAAEAVNTLTRTAKVRHYEIPFDKYPSEYYEGFKASVIQANRGNGVIVIYDTEALEGVLSVLGAETGIEIRGVMSPLLNVGEALIRDTAAGGLDALYRAALRIMMNAREPPATVALLADDSEESSYEWRRRIEDSCAELKVAVLEEADPERLKFELASLMTRADVRCVVGTRNPRLFGLPYIPVTVALAMSPAELPDYLSGKSGRPAAKPQDLDYEAVYGYMAEHLAHTDAALLKRLVPPVVRAIHDTVAELTFDAEVGLMVHIPCCIDRMRAGQSTPPNPQRERIIEKYPMAFKKLLKIVSPLEKAFKVVFNDDEIAFLLMVIYKIS